MFSMEIGEQPKDGVTKDKEGCLVKTSLLCKAVLASWHS